MNLEDVLRALKRGTLRKITSLGNIAQDELRAHLELITDEGVEAYLFGDEGAPPNVLAVVRAFLGRCEPFSRLLIIKAYRDLLSTDDLSESLGRAREIVARRLDDILSGGAKRFGELLRAHLQEISLTAALNHGLIEVTRACQLVSAGEEAPSPWELRLALDLAGEPHKIFGEVLLLLDKKQDLIGIHARLQTLEDLQSLQQIQRHLVEGEELRLDLDALAVLLDDVLEYERPDGLSWREARALITPEEHTESAPDDEATLLAPESAPEDLGAGAEDNAPSTSAEERSYAKEDPLTLADGIQLARGSIGISEFFLQELIAEAVDKVHDDHPVTIAALLRRLGGVAGGAFLMHREHGAAILSALLSSAGELNVSSATPPADSLVRCAENTPPSLDAAPAPQAHVASPPPKAAVETTSPPQTAPNPQTIALLRRHLIRELEELQRGPATPFVWEETCAVVDQLLTFMPFVEVEALLSLERFPDEVRVAPSFWSRAFANARVTWLPLIKHLHLGDRTLTEAPFLTAQETAFTLNSVGFERCSFAP
ncbi:MAG: hypothetical protein VX475_14805, partial [Myxococcota bacterium]|nr:hypothetical protein [Myxococcota bacterium]